jgi:hypothetical protein
MVCDVWWLTCCWKSGEPRGAKEGGGGKGEGWGGSVEGLKSCSTRDTNRSCCCPLNLQYHKDKDKDGQESGASAIGADVVHSFTADAK